MTNTIEYLIVTPTRVARRPTMQAALKLARDVDTAAAARHGAGAGADCYVVARLSDGTLSYRGMACGRRLIGRGLGCAGYVLRRATDAIA